MDTLNESTRIKLNIGGTKFETTYGTLKQSEFFRVWFNRWNREEECFVDRSGTIFEHVLNYLRNPLYYYPKDNLDELDYYGIDTIPTNFIQSAQKLEYCYEAVKKLGKLCKVDFCLNSISNSKFLYCDSCHKFELVNKEPEIGDFVYINSNMTTVVHTGPFLVKYCEYPDEGNKEIEAVPYEGLVRHWHYDGRGRIITYKVEENKRCMIKYIDRPETIIIANSRLKLLKEVLNDANKQ